MARALAVLAKDTGETPVASGDRLPFTAAGRMPSRNTPGEPDEKAEPGAPEQETGRE